MTKVSSNQKIVKIEHISFAKYTPGTLALGYILQIIEDAVVVSLPGGFTGTISYQEISDVCFGSSSKVASFLLILFKYMFNSIISSG